MYFSALFYNFKILFLDRFFISTFFDRKESGERNSRGCHSIELNNCTFRHNRVNSGLSGVNVLFRNIICSFWTNRHLPTRLPLRQHSLCCCLNYIVCSLRNAPNPLSFNIIVFIFVSTTNKQAKVQALRSEQSMLVRQLQSNFCLRDWQVDKWKNIFFYKFLLFIAIYPWKSRVKLLWSNVTIN